MKPTRDQALHAVTTLLRYAGEDPQRPGLLETPDRVVKAFDNDWFTGYRMDPGEVLKSFDEEGGNYDGIVFQGSLPVTSLCEHHMAQIFGVAHFGYIPSGRVVGLSKIMRLINVFARRLQVQERLSSQIVDAFMEYVPCKGCGIVMELRHMCMESRGIRVPNTTTRSSQLRGIFLEDHSTQQEFMSLVRMENGRP